MRNSISWLTIAVATAMMIGAMWNRSLTAQSAAPVSVVSVNATQMVLYYQSSGELVVYQGDRGRAFICVGKYRLPNEPGAISILQRDCEK